MLQYDRIFGKLSASDFVIVAMVLSRRCSRFQSLFQYCVFEMFQLLQSVCCSSLFHVVTTVVCCCCSTMSMVFQLLHPMLQSALLY